jgi:hypothetical protein
MHSLPRDGHSRRQILGSMRLRRQDSRSQIASLRKQAALPTTKLRL